jgi:hypothetical protein
MKNYLKFLSNYIITLYFYIAKTNCRHSYFLAQPTTYQMRTAISGCKTTYLVDKVNTKQYELRAK